MKAGLFWPCIAGSERGKRQERRAVNAEYKQCEDTLDEWENEFRREGQWPCTR